MYIPWDYDERRNLNLVPDENEVLDKNFLNPIWKFLKNNWEISDINLDDEQLSNLMNWYNSYKMLYSYPWSDVSQNKLINNFESEVWRYDLMNLVEVSVWILLQNEFDSKWYNARVRKTSKNDDVNSWVDYIIEFYDNKRKIEKLLWVDLTLSEKKFESLEKVFNSSVYPRDYAKFHRKKYWKSIGWEMPRVVINIQKEIAYAFTNNFFDDVLTESNWLAIDIDKNFKYAIEDVKWLVKLKNTSFKIASFQKQTGKRVEKLLSKK